MNEKPTYEQLEKVAQNLNQQCKQLYEKLLEAERVINNFNDVGLLLTIIKQSEYFNEDFIDRCTKKIETVVTSLLDSTENSESN